ncbi:MAG: helix-turn-helix transcriptional regulator [Anaerolineae bacterium]|nr:MAG: helix-turn-helix transcriptional regulator [Anaerolineae bacterium]
MDTVDSFGYWIRRRRKALDMTQDELAQRVGCAPVSLRKIEADERRPSLQMAQRLATCLALPLEDHARFIAAALRQQATARLPRPGLPHLRPVTGNLPTSLTSLIGRSAEMTLIADRLQNEGAPGDIDRPGRCGQNPPGAGGGLAVAHRLPRWGLPGGAGARAGCGPGAFSHGHGAGCTRDARL